MDEKTAKEVLWRLKDIREMLKERGVDGAKLYGCDEWSVPIVNLNNVIAIIALEQESGT